MGNAANNSFLLTGEHCERVECERDPLLSRRAGLQHLQGRPGSAYQVPVPVPLLLNTQGYNHANQV